MDSWGKKTSHNSNRKQKSPIYFRYFFLLFLSMFIIFFLVSRLLQKSQYNNYHNNIVRCEVINTQIVLYRRFGQETRNQFATCFFPYVPV